MKKAFELLGLPTTADAKQVRAAYRAKVKLCHPDRFQDPERQKEAQNELIQLNLAYEKALKVSSIKHVGFSLISQIEAKDFAYRLMKQNNLKSALRQLNRAETKDADWYYLQGKILMGLRQFDTAHQSYREAIKLEPNNRIYRKGAFDAALATKNSKKITYKVSQFIKDTFKNRR